MCARRAVGIRYVENYEASPHRKILGRSAANLFSGEDWDYCMTATELGMGVGRMPGLSLTHLIPERRTTEEYILRIAEGHKFSAQVVLAIRGLPLAREKFRRKRYGLLLRGLVRPSFQKKVMLAEMQGLEKGLEFVSKMEL